MINRRTFLKFSSAGALTLYALNEFGLEGAIAAIPGGTFPPGAIPKFVTPLVIPPAMPTSGLDHYTIAVRQFSQQILPASLPPTTVWSYGSTTDASTFNYPAFTIEATRGTPTIVTWINELKNGSGNFLPHLLPVDPTLHWANPPTGTNALVNGTGTRDSRPIFATTPGRYTGPVPIVTHVHGMERVEDWSDGYAEAWYLPDATNIPAGFAREGTWYDFFRGKAASAGVTTGAPVGPRFRYPNSQRPSTAWYHDHTLGMTRLNVYAGPAGFYLVRSTSSDDNPRISGAAGSAVLPGPAPACRRKSVRHVLRDPDRDPGPLVQCQRLAVLSRHAGVLRRIPGPYIPGSEMSPIWNPEFFGNCIVVNGRTWPFLEVEPRRYRFRLLNGCQSRFLILSFDDPEGRGLADRRRRRLPARAGQARTYPHGAGGACGHHRRLLPGEVRHERYFAQHGAGRAVRGRRVPQGRSRAAPGSSCSSGSINRSLRWMTRHRPNKLVMPALLPLTGRRIAAARVARNGVRATGARASHGNPSGHVRSGSRRTGRHRVQEMGRRGDGESQRPALPKYGSCTTSPPTLTRSTSTRCSSRS